MMPYMFMENKELRTVVGDNISFHLVSQKLIPDDYYIMRKPPEKIPSYCTYNVFLDVFHVIVI